MLTGLDTGNENFTNSFLIILQGFVTSTMKTMLDKKKNDSVGEPSEAEKTESREEKFNKIFSRRLRKKLRQIQKRKERKPRSAAEVEAFFTRHLKKKKKKESESEGVVVEDASDDGSATEFSSVSEDSESSGEDYVQLREVKATVYDNMKSEDEPTTEDYIREKKTHQEWEKEHKAMNNILGKLQHYVSHKNLGVKLLALEILKVGLEAISSNVGKLLPLIHTLWDPLRFRFFDQDERVAIRALEVMRVMAKHSREFVSKRVADDLWPVLKEKLVQFNYHNWTVASASSSSPSSSAKTRYITPGRYDNYLTQYSRSGTSAATRDLALKTSVAFKSQLSMLACLTVVCQHVDLSDNTVRDITKTCSFYLEREQPKELREEALRLFIELKKSDADFVWLHLQSLVDYSPPEKPHVSFNNPIFYRQSEGDFRASVKFLVSVV